MKKHFTLMELLIVIAIIAILFSMMFPSFSKARKNALTATCLSNQKQLSTATTLYMVDNKYRFPVGPTAPEANRGRFWVGKAGESSEFTMAVTRRPVNAYLGYDSDGIETPLAACPIGETAKKRYNASGTNYMAAARIEHSDDFDNGSTPLALAKVKFTSAMVLFGETGAWHHSQSPYGYWTKRMYLHEEGKPKFSFSFVDGHAAVKRVTGGMGTDFPSEVNFRNFK